MTAPTGLERIVLPRWFAPAVFIALPVAASFGAWWLLALSRDFQPATVSLQALTGFDTPSQASVEGVVLLLVWYIAVIAAATIGWRLGVDKRPALRVARYAGTARFQRYYFSVILAVATVGIGYSYLKIMRNASIVDSLSSQTGNNFTNSLSGSTGLETLRYATILAAPVGLYLWRQGIVRWPFMLAGLLLLASNSLIASRLSLLMASVVYLAIWVTANARSGREGWSTGKRLAALTVIFVVGFSALATLNFFRNANYYREAGVTSPVAMNLYQMGSYLGVPAQVSIGVSDAVMTGAWENPGAPVTSPSWRSPGSWAATTSAPGWTSAPTGTAMACRTCSSTPAAPRRTAPTWAPPTSCPREARRRLRWRTRGTRRGSGRATTWPSWAT